MKHCITILLIALSFTVIAQSEPKQYVGLAIGPSFPTGDFSKTVLSDSTSGFAVTGIGIEFTYAYQISRFFGLKAIINYSGNNIDNPNLTNQLLALHPDYSATIEVTKNWRSGGLMVGPYLTFPLSEKLSWDVKGLFGFYNAYSVAFNIYTHNNVTGEKNQYQRNAGRDFSYAYLVGTGFKYKLTKYYLLLFADYVNSPLQFDNAYGYDWEDEPFTAKVTQNISFVSVTLGLGYFF